MIGDKNCSESIYIQKLMIIIFSYLCQTVNISPFHTFCAQIIKSPCTINDEYYCIQPYSVWTCVYMTVQTITTIYHYHPDLPSHVFSMYMRKLKSLGRDACKLVEDSVQCDAIINNYQVNLQTSLVHDLLQNQYIAGSSLFEQDNFIKWLLPSSSLREAIESCQLLWPLVECYFC